MIGFIESAVSSLLYIINQLGYMGIFVGMTIESSFFPFPSELILIPAGALVAEGKMSFVIILCVAVAGSLLGALINYFLALFLGRRVINRLVSKYGKALFLSKEKLEKSDDYFKKHGEVTTFVGRLIPGIRQIISLPAGFSKMSIHRFAIFTSMGAGIWSLFLIFVGYLAGNNKLWLRQHSLPVTFSVLIIALTITIIYILRKRKTNVNR